MKLIRYNKKNSQAIYGWLEDEIIYEIEGDILTQATKGKRIARLQDAELLAPCIPTKIIAIAINYPGIGGYSPTMQEPLVFLKPGSSACGVNEKVFNPFNDLPWWGESELAVVMKQKITKKISESEAKNYILGFTIGNDVTVENIEHRDHHLARSKCANNFCPMGPWIDTEFDASNCLIEAIQNGEVIRRAYSSQQVWKWEKIISWLSGWMTLEPWDVILTGNPPDTVGMRFLNHGDCYTAKVHGLGELTNYFYQRGLE